jgi:hypothetical protein
VLAIKMRRYDIEAICKFDAIGVKTVWQYNHILETAKISAGLGVTEKGIKLGG